jgi:heme O synthase-like polyprenyltransferase
MAGKRRADTRRRGRALVACPVGLAIPWSTVALASMGTVMAAMSASAFNQIMEVTNDSRMARTARRPLVTGKISHQHAMFVTSATGVRPSSDPQPSTLYPAPETLTPKL